MMTTKQPSPELLSLIKAAAQGLQAFGTLWESIKKKGHDEGFTEPELQGMIKPMLRDNLGMDRNKIYYLFHKEERAISNKEAYEKRRINQQIDVKKPTEQNDTPKVETPYIPNTNRDIEKANDVMDLNDDEDPRDTEIQFQKEKIAELEDALKKTTEFKPANQIGFTKEDTDMNTTVFRMGIKDFTRAKEFIAREMSDYISKDFTAMKNRGWAVVEVTIKVV